MSRLSLLPGADLAPLDGRGALPFESMLDSREFVSEAEGASRLRVEDSVS